MHVERNCQKTAGLLREYSRMIGCASTHSLHTKCIWSWNGDWRSTSAARNSCVHKRSIAGGKDDEDEDKDDEDEEEDDKDDEEEEEEDDQDDA